MVERRDATVLLVDDESNLVDLYDRFLSPAYEVHTATSGDEALETIDESFDVALLDRRMPDMSGDEVLEEIRARDLDVRVAMLTAVEPEVDIVDMAFDDYKVKPVDRDDLYGVVELLLKRGAYDEQSREYFSLASKKAALETADNDDTEEYDDLVEEMDALREEIDATLREVGAEAAFKDLADQAK